MKKLISLTLIILSVIFISNFASSAMAFVFTDDFEDGVINPSWTVHLEGGSTIQEIGGHLEMTQGPGTDLTLTQLILNQLLGGDFFAQVDFELLNWPIGNYERIAIIGSNGFESGAVEQTGDLGYLTNFSDGTVGYITNSDVIGKLKIERKGSKLSGYYWKSNDWELIHSYETPFPTDSTIKLQIWTANFKGGDYGVKVAFDNVFVNLTPNPIPEPASILLLSIGGLAMAALKRKKKLS